MEQEDDEQFCNNCKRPVSSANFALHSAFCERNIFVCKICDEPVQKSERTQHLEEYHVVSPCDLCELPFEKWMLSKHMESCPKRKTVCEYCEGEFPFDELSEHVDFCSSRTEKCLLCQKYVMLKHKAEHNELHMYEKKLRCKNIEEEIKQNKLNEVISKGALAGRTGEVSEVKHKPNIEKESVNRLDRDRRERGDESFTDKSKVKIRTEDQNLEIQNSEGAVASLPNKTKEYSKHHTKCHICFQTIPWIDMNTHVPSCASSAGKCSVCGEVVPSYALKEHMKEHSQGKVQKPSLRATENGASDSEMNRIRNDGSYAAKSRQSDFEVNKIRSDESYASKSRITDETIKCPYCSQLCSEDRILSHTRTCPMNTFECPLCNERIPEKNRIRHETSDCRMIHENDESNRSYISRSSAQSFYECPLCNEKVPEKEKMKHETSDCRMIHENDESNTSHFSRDTSQSLFECPLCSDNIPEEDRDKHLSFECRSLMSGGGTHGLYSMKDSASDEYQCPLCLEHMLEKDKARHENFECKILIESTEVQFCEKSCAAVPKKTCRCRESGSYADVTKKQCGCKCQVSQNSEVCIICKNRISVHKMAEHRRTCQREKFSCLHCNVMIDAACEEIHLNYCPALKNKSYKDLKTRVNENSRTSPYDYRGAIPKNANIRDMMRPRTAKCMYCQTTLNADIVKYHEEECVLRPVQCPDCLGPITLKELGVHSCKKKKGKGKNNKGNHQPSEEKDTGIKKKFLDFIGYNQDKRDNVNNKHYPYSNSPSVPQYPSPRYNQDEVVGDNQRLYFENIDNTLLPCEFCHREFPASELVLHETGCNPELVSYAKPSSAEDTHQRKPSFRQEGNSDSRSQNIHISNIKSPFFDATSSFLPPTKFERIKDRESDVEPGEFLKSNSETSTEFHKYPKRDKNAAVEKKTEPLQSVWNIKTPNDFKAKNIDSKHISGCSDDEMDVDQTEESINGNKMERRHLKEHEKKISEELDDNEMTEIFNFIKHDIKNTESGEEYKISSDRNARKVEREISEGEEALDSNFSNYEQESHQKDLNLSRKTTTDEKAEKMYMGTSRFIDNKDQKGYVSSTRYQKVLKFDTDESKVLSSADIVHHTRKELLEKDNEEPEKLCAPKLSSYIDSTKDEKECVGNWRQKLVDLKFDAPKTEPLFYEDNVDRTALLGKDKEEPKPSSYIGNVNDKKEIVSNWRQKLVDFKFGAKAESMVDFKFGALKAESMVDFKFGALKAESMSYKDNVHHTAVLEKDNNKQNLTIDSAESEEYIRNFEQRLSNLKFCSQETKILSAEDNVYRSAVLEKNSDEPKELLCKQNSSISIDSVKDVEEYLKNTSISIDSVKDAEEYLKNFKQQLSDFKFGPRETRSEVLQKSNRDNISDDLENFCNQTSRHVDDVNKNYKECVTKTKYMLDTKYDAHNARFLPSEDNVPHTYLPAFKIEPAQGVAKDSRFPICTVSSKQAEKVEALDERVAKLHKRNLVAASQEEDDSKWKSWRETKHSSSEEDY